MRAHEHYRHWTAAYVLGALDPVERHEFEEHLSQCAECQEEVRSFAPIPGLLAKVEQPGPVTVPGSIEERAVSRVRSEWTALVRSRRRWQVLAVAAALATVFAFATLLSTPAPGSGTLLVFSDGALARGEIAVDQRPWGTEVVLELEELPDASFYTAWAIDEGGNWYHVAAWGPTPNSSVMVVGASPLDVADLDRIVVTTGDRDRMILEAWPADA